MYLRDPSWTGVVLSGSNGIEIRRRSVPGTRTHVSELGFTVAPTTRDSPVLGDRLLRVLRSARARGVTTFQVPDSPTAPRGERLLADAFPTADPECTVLVGRSWSTLAEEAGRTTKTPPADGLEGLLLRSLVASEARLAPLSIGIVEWTHESDSAIPLAAAAEVLDRVQRTGAFAAWSLVIRPGEPLTDGGRGPESGAGPLFSGEISPLDPRLVHPLAVRAAAGPVGFFARDPLGSGRLDGTRFARSIADRRPDVPPVNVRALRREFDPVLRMSFLTEGRQRTLAQAAVRFAVDWPWVCSALVPIPSPERLEEIVRSTTVPPLSELEVERILTASPSPVLSRGE